MDFGEPGADVLATKLRALAEQVARDLPEYAAAAEAFILRLQAARAGSGSPRVGQSMPDFMLPDADGELVPLGAFAGGPLVMVFLRGHWCDFCQAQASALVEVAEALQTSGATVAIITPERPRYARALITEASSFRLLCDLDNGYAASLGLMAVIDATLARVLADFGVDLPAYQGAKGWAVPIPATFVVNGMGNVVDRAFDPDYRRRPSLHALFDAISRAR